MPTFTNRLAKESSPYLLQHAHNPVDWYPWGAEALQKAKNENKPVLVSIGYAACHWCHVMEKESFEDEATAKTMNELFVNIKIDREERPDLDHIYMDAVQAMTGSGGWPLNVFLTPDGKPFYGGTYFPPRAVHNRPSWSEVLNAVAIAFRERRNEIDTQAENLTEHIRQSNAFGQQPITSLTKDVGAEMFSNIMKQADRVEGGFGQAPKFPQTFTIRYLLNYYYHTKNQEALAQACLSLDKMIRGGIYDQAGGGFARYSTDNSWLVPHFEKMLYDNALLVTTLSDAYKITGNTSYKRCIEQTMEFVERELLSPETGFWSALDADSEGVEGKFYVWSKEEIDVVLGNDSPLFCELFDVTESGNWEHANILNMPIPVEELAAKKQVSAESMWQLADSCLTKLLKDRSRRIRPLLDDKILLGWNALMNTACCNAYAATGHDKYKTLAIRNMEFIWKNFREKDGRFYHTWKNDIAKYPAFLDDYSYLIEALIHLQEITGDTGYLHKGKMLVELVIERFSEEETGFFFFTANDQGDVIVRKKEVYDGAVPAGNSVMAANLYYLGIVFANEGWKERGARMCESMLPVTQKYPTSFGIWATMTLALSYNNIPEIAIVGENFASVLIDILRTFIPFCIIQSAPHDNKDFPLLTEKPSTQGALIYLCRHYACQTPVTETNELVRLLEIV